MSTAPAMPPVTPGEPNPVNEPYLLTAQAAERLHVSPKTVSRWAKEGKLPFLRTLGGHRRYRQADIDAIAQAGYEAATTPIPALQQQ